MNQPDNSLMRLIAMYFSPFALPHRVAGKHASRHERDRIHRYNLLHLRPFMRRYIFRSGQLILGCFIASLLFASLLPFPLLAIAACLGIILAVLHTVLLIFIQQSANNMAAREGLKNDEIEH
ncbi:hypothetical protein [Sedimenticola sp.]|uniref:hypothetical protein n=1 Tax=Sedimenticola sp. TaxID=1940285 RepID=UPI003D14E8F6